MCQRCKKDIEPLEEGLRRIAKLAGWLFVVIVAALILRALVL